MIKPVVVAVVVFVAAASAAASAAAQAPESESGRFAGPRLGVTWLSQAVRDDLDDKTGKGPTAILQFGWQWEQRFEIGPHAPLLMTQFVVLVGGAEQGIFLPSASWLIGFRSRGGGEFGLGPNLSLAGFGIAIAAGVTTRLGAVNVPWNLAVVPGDPGLRLSVLTGFNMAAERMTPGQER